jgi:hypothetical protein
MDLERNNESETRPQNLKVEQPQRDWRILIGTLDPTAWLAGPCTIERSSVTKLSEGCYQTC